MAKDFGALEDSNPSANPSLHDLSAPERRTVLRLGLGAAAAALYGPLGAQLAGCAGPAAHRPTLGFAAVPPSPNFGPPDPAATQLSCGFRPFSCLDMYPCNMSLCD